MIVHEHTLTARVDPSVVWDRWTQVEHWPVDDPFIVRAKLNGPIAKGAIGWVKAAKGPRTVFRFAEVDRMARRFVVQSALFLATITEEHEMTRVEETEDPHDWQITQRLIFTGLLARAWNRYIGKDMAAQLPATLDRVVGAASL